MKKEYFYTKSFSFWFIVLLRLTTAFLVFQNALLGITIVLILDHLDAYVWIHYLKMKRHKYYFVDKIVDFLVYLIVLFSTISTSFFFILTLFFIYRVLGLFLIAYSKNSKLYIIFPNLFEFLYVWFNLFPVLKIAKGSSVFWLGIIIAVCLKEFQEIFIYYLWPKHLKKYGYPNALKIFGQKKKVSW